MTRAAFEDDEVSVRTTPMTRLRGMERVKPQFQARRIVKGLENWGFTRSISPPKAGFIGVPPRVSVAPFLL